MSVGEQSYHTPQPCPHCGACPTCGRGASQFGYWHRPPYPYYVWCSASGGANAGAGGSSYTLGGTNS